jgi:nucleotide-binding universal stress UspA family protein
LSHTVRCGDISRWIYGWIRPDAGHRGIAMNSNIQSIVHPTDFSDLSGRAFAHALRIALAARSTLHVLHVAERDNDDEVTAFPHVRQILTQWGLIEENDTPQAVAAKLGINVSNMRLDRQKPLTGILSFLDQHASDLVVLATHGREGIDRWLKGSVAETVFRRSAIPTLFVAPSARGFVSQVSGDIALRRVLVPVDHSPAPAQTVEAVRRFAQLLTGSAITLHLLHVGSSAPVVYGTSSGPQGPLPVMLRSGNVVKSILDAAIEFEADLIGMPTAGHHGVLDAVRGSTTERVLRHAPCPLFAVSAG